MSESVDFKEQVQVIADTIPADLQVHLFGRKIEDGFWVHQGTEDADRIRIVAGLIFALKATYSNYGIESWFERPSQRLNGKAPKDFLHGKWHERNPDVQMLTRLALFHARRGHGGPKNDLGLH